MKRYIYTLCIVMVCTAGFLSCLGETNTTDITIYDETAITSMKLLAYNKYVHTTGKSGNDSVYKTTITKNFPTFTIDQYTKTIYNTDSLPFTADLTRVVIQLGGSTYSGSLYVKSMVSDTLFYYSSSDSIDFTKPREIRVYNYDGSRYRAYQVSVNKHQVETSKMLWEKMSAEAFPGRDNEKWEKAVATARLDAFIGASSVEGYAFSHDGRLMISKDEGATWLPDSLDDDATLLPTRSFAFTNYPVVTTAGADYQLLVGTREATDSICHIWRKIAEHSERSLPSKWVYIPMEWYNQYALPAMSQLSLVYFQGNVLAIGHAENIYCSRDGGITWKVYDKYAYPDDCLSSDSMEAVTDDEGALWLKDKDTNEVWRGVLVEE